jgi:2C-methyl-D-erythritol 2,4-cyclodiphosphate synthase
LCNISHIGNRTPCSFVYKAEEKKTGVHVKEKRSMKYSPFILTTLIAVLILSACAPAQVDPQVTPEPPPIDQPAVQAARQALAQELGISPDQIEVVQVEEEEWPDACLGLPEPGEFCATVITPGYRVILEAEGEQYEVRTDLEGDIVRMDVEEPAAVEAARQALAQELGISPDQIEVVQVEEEEWPDACLGLPEPGEFCATVITPGYRVILEAEGEQYEVRTDLEGDIVRMEVEEPAAVEAARQALAQELRINPDQIEVVEVEGVDWPDSCLGLPEPDEACLTVITPGYRVILEAEGEQYEVRTDLEGDTVRMESPAEVAVDAARQVLARQLEMDASEIQVSLVMDETFPNACLGLAEEDEMCADVLVDGWVIELMAHGKSYLFHTNRDGSSLRQARTAHEGGATIPADRETGETPQAREDEAPSLNDRAVQAAKAALSGETGVPVETIRLLEMTQVDWRDGCLEVHEAGTGCIMVITPGYSIILEAEGQKYEVRTNLSGSQSVVVGNGGTGSRLIEE